VKRFYVSNKEEFSLCRKRQYSYNERNTLRLRGNCERNFDSAFSSSFEITFFLDAGLHLATKDFRRFRCLDQSQLKPANIHPCETILGLSKSIFA